MRSFSAKPDAVKVSIGIQARSTSERFPGKITEFIGTKMMIDHVIDACKDCATYTNAYTFSNNTHCSVYVLIPEHDEVKSVLSLDPAFIIEGPEKDVLKRYVIMAEKTSAEYVVRITSDCPLIPPFLIYKAIVGAVKNQYDYFSNVGDLDEVDNMRTSIDGHDVEVMSMRALKWADQNAVNGQREHVTTILRGPLAPKYFKKGILIGHNDHSSIKLSVDNRDDLSRVREEYESLQRKIKLAERKFGKKSVHRF